MHNHTTATNREPDVYHSLIDGEISKYVDKNLSFRRYFYIYACLFYDTDDDNNNTDDCNSDDDVHEKSFFDYISLLFIYSFIYMYVCIFVWTIGAFFQWQF